MDLHETFRKAKLKKINREIKQTNKQQNKQRQQKQKERDTLPTQPIFPNDFSQVVYLFLNLLSKHKPYTLLE